MTNFTSWEHIYGTDSRRLVLILDIPAMRHCDFTLLTTGAEPGCTLLRAKLPPADWAGSHLGFWLDGIPSGTREVLTVIGYRIGGVYAAAIASDISKVQVAPRLVVLEPQAVTAQLLVDEFKREIATISSLLSDDELERAKTIADEISSTGPSDIARVGAEICRHYRELSVVAFERVGLGGTYDNNAITSFEPCIACICEAAIFDNRGNRCRSLRPRARSLPTWNATCATRCYGCPGYSTIMSASWPPCSLPGILNPERVSNERDLLSRRRA